MIMTLDDFSLRSSSATWPRFTSDPYIAAGFLHSDELSGSFSPREDPPLVIGNGNHVEFRCCEVSGSPRVILLSDHSERLTSLRRPITADPVAKPLPAGRDLATDQR